MKSVRIMLLLALAGVSMMANMCPADTKQPAVCPQLGAAKCTTYTTQANCVGACSMTAANTKCAWTPTLNVTTCKTTDVAACAVTAGTAATTTNCPAATCTIVPAVGGGVATCTTTAVAACAVTAGTAATTTNCPAATCTIVPAAASTTGTCAG